METSFQSKIVKILKTDPRFIDQDGELVKAAIIDRAWKTDHDLVKLLLSEASIKLKFFDEIQGHWVFNVNTFIDYVSDKDFLDNSYTRFRNKIGLNIDGKYLKERGEVCLVWPYKDCVLEGGQTKEEEKRKEIFFNEILAQDEIDRLLDPKVLTNWKRYTTEGEQKVSEIRRDGDGLIRENLIVLGNNLLVLHSLNAQFRGKVKLIYIDPPFNTGDDEFGYNDKFNHSAWLTFINNRLEIAKKLLSASGILCVHIGNHEVSYIQILIDEIFGRENYLNHITMTTNDPSGFKATSSKIFSTTNHIFIYSRSLGSDKLYKDKLYVPKEYDEAYKFVLLNPKDAYQNWKFTTITKLLSEQSGSGNIKDFKKSQSEQELHAKIAEFADRNRKVVFRTAAVGGGALAKRKDTVAKSKKNRGHVYQHPNEDIEGFYILNGEQIVFWDNNYHEIDGKLVPSETLTDAWTDISFTGIANEGGVKLKKGKKPEKLLKRIIELCTEKNDLVLDFFVGSGTTAAVSHKLGRQYIGIEQLDYGKNDSVVRLKKVINGDKSGVSKVVKWKGGGDFIYCELLKYNEFYIDSILSTKTSDQLVEIWKGISSNSFLNWYINPEAPEDALSDFVEIGKSDNGVDKQKKLLCELLNKNQLYVNLSEIEDAKFSVSKHDKELNKQFYGEAYNA